MTRVVFILAAAMLLGTAGLRGQARGMPTVDFTRYRLHDEVGEVLREWHELFPNLTRLHTIGSSYWGKDLWVLEVTNFARSARASTTTATGTSTRTTWAA